MRILTLAVTIALLAGCAGISREPWIQQAQNVWLLTYESGSGGTALPVASWQDEDGGWVVAFATPKHVIEGEKSAVSASLGDIRLDHGDVVAEHPNLDVAVLMFPSDGPVPTLSLSGRIPRIGERLLLSSWQGMRFLWVTEGLACSRDRMSAPNWPGGSGGAVLDERGDVIGMATGLGISQVPFSPFQVLIPHQCYFVPSVDFAEWVRSTFR
jgi:hypothetical protein